MLKDEVLQLLRQSGGYLSGQHMSQVLGVSRTAVWKAVDALREDGYEIDSVTRKGYRLLHTTRDLRLQEVCACLGEHPWLDRLQLLETVDSTNTAVKRLAEAGAPEGTAVLANCQTGGKGRLGRTFLSPPSMGLYASFLLRPAVQPAQLLHLTPMAAVAAADAVEAACHIRPGIKWTNDLVLGRKKVAGILTELSVEAESGQVQSIVVGIGFNCSQRPEDFPPELRDMATSLESAGCGPVDRNRLAAELVRSMQRLSAELLTGKEKWMDRYARDCITIGQDVRIVCGQQEQFAHAEGVDENGALLVVHRDGRRQTIASGEVSVRGMYGYL